MKLTTSSVLLYLSSINIADANVDCFSLKVPEACEAVGCTWRGLGVGEPEPGPPPGVCSVNCNGVQEQKDCDRVKECKWQFGGFGDSSGSCVVDLTICDGIPSEESCGKETFCEWVPSLGCTGEPCGGECRLGGTTSAVTLASSQVTEEDPVKMEEASGSSHAGLMFSTLLVGYFVAYWA